ncbi:MAG: type III secretion system translocon subunit SctE [Endozoicomonas sp.]
MPTIQQGPSKASISQSAPSQVKGSDVPVKRGFSKQNSYSRIEPEESVRSQVQTPRLDEPSAEAESDKATSEILEKYAEDADTPMTDQLMKAVHDRKNNPMAGQIALLQGKKGDLQKQGFTESQIEGLMALADPNSPGNSLSGMHSTTARLNDAQANGGDPKLNKVHDLFYDVVLQYTAITEIPDDLRADIEADLEALTKAAFDSNQPLDIDSATTMLISIQSKLQNERVKFDQETIRIGQINKEQVSSKFIETIRDGIAKAKEAEKSALVGKIFGYLAIAAMAIATAIVAAVGVIFTGGLLTVVAVGMMLAATTLTVAMMISSETNNFMTNMFGDSKEAKIGAMVFWTAIIMALSLGGAVAGGFAGSAAGAGAGAGAGLASGASSGATVAATGANTAATATTTAAKFSALLTKIAKIVQVVGGVSQVAEGSSQVATSVYTYHADMMRADAMEDRAMMARIQQMLDDAMESLQTVIDELQQGYSVAANIIKANHDTKSTLVRNVRA